LINNETHKLNDVSNAVGYVQNKIDINGKESGLDVKW
jgi:hypothetical protein